MTQRSTDHALASPIEPDCNRSFAALLERAANEQAALDARLLHDGALLFRGWDVDSTEQLLRFVRIFSGDAPLFRYAGGASPRTGLGGGSYSSTEYPPHLQLALHNELSYTSDYPLRLYFLCLVAPADGGETTIGDSRRILARIDPAILAKLRRAGVRYIRNLSSAEGSGYSWQDAFEADDPAQAEEWCRRNGADFEWRSRVLHMTHDRPATTRHPQTGEEVWFNQADGFHPSGLDASSYAELLDLCGSEDRFRLNATYGDGEPFEAAMLAHIRDAIRRETMPHRWQSGDVLVLDNLLAAHGRMPFTGPRKIALAMT
jgi:alpha-ketoglutarate-dependent taurine dioxygenase